jgi:Cu/Ag efflux protein CusF
MAVRAVATAFIMMLTVVSSMAVALTLTVTTSAVAQSDVPGPGMQDGIVAGVDTAAGVVKLEDGRMYRLKPGAELVYRGSPTPLSALRPGNYITISGAEPVEYRDGQYVLSPGS